MGGGEPAQGASLEATGEGILRIGGLAARNAKDAKQDLRSSEPASLYDLEKKTWTELPKLPERRSSHDSAVVGVWVERCRWCRGFGPEPHRGLCGPHFKLASLGGGRYAWWHECRDRGLGKADG